MHVFAPSFLLIGFHLLKFHTSAHPHHAHRGLPGAFYACPLPDWRASSDHECQWINIEQGRCMALDGQVFPPNFSIGSMGPDESGWCNLYNTPDCDGEQKGTYIGALKFPGNTDTTAWNIKSLLCAACGTGNCVDIPDPLNFYLHRHKYGKGQ